MRNTFTANVLRSIQPNFAAIADYGLRISGIHTISAAWPKLRIGPNYRLSFECRLTEEGQACWWLGGPGYGNSTALGYTCVFNGGHAVLYRDGNVMQEIDLAKPFTAGQDFTVHINRDQGHIAVKINEITLFDHTDKVPLSGSLHSWIGLGSVGGGWSSGVRYRNLVIETPEKIIDSPLTLTPPSDRAFSSSTRTIYQLNMAADTLPTEWWCSEPQSVRFDDKTMVMTGPNCTPECILNKPIAGDFALNVKMEYLFNDALNFSVPLYFAQGESLNRTNDPQCRLVFPNGFGLTDIGWVKPGSGWQSLAQTAYYAPISGKVYGLRLERVGTKLRVLVNGGLLLTAVMPIEKLPEQSSVYIGVSQVYSGVKIHELNVEYTEGY